MNVRPRIPDPQIGIPAPCRVVKASVSGCLSQNRSGLTVCFNVLERAPPRPAIKRDNARLLETLKRLARSPGKVQSLW